MHDVAQNKYMKQSPTFIHVKTIIKNSSSGLFSYLLSSKISPKITSDILYSSLNGVIDQNNQNSAFSNISYSSPIYFDIDLGRYKVHIFDYMIQGYNESRMMREWEILGRNRKTESWQQIDYRNDVPYCTKYYDVCYSIEKYYITALNPIEPFRYIRFNMINDQCMCNDYRLRLLNFEVFGSIVMSKICSCNRKTNSNLIIATTLVLISRKL